MLEGGLLIVVLHGSVIACGMRGWSHLYCYCCRFFSVVGYTTASAVSTLELLSPVCSFPQSFVLRATFFVACGRR